MIIDKNIRRRRRKFSIRKKVIGTRERPRLTVFRSCKNIYVQVIDDERSETICSSSSLEKLMREERNGGRFSGLEMANKIGHLIGQRLKGRDILKVIFDRNGYKYHGQVKAIADACRLEGIEF